MIGYDTEDALKRVLCRHLGSVDQKLLQDLGVICEWSTHVAMFDAGQSCDPPDFPLVMLSKLGVLHEHSR